MLCQEAYNYKKALVGVSFCWQINHTFIIMRRSITFIPTTFIIGALFALILFLAPAAAKAETVDTLLTRVQAVMEEMAKIQAELQALKSSQTTASTPAPNTPSGEVAGATSFKFTQETVYGATNDDIKRIQELLATDEDIYPEGITSGFFGPATQRAIQNLQTRFGYDPVGVVGPATTGILERLISQQNSDGTYPADILDPNRPAGSVAGVSTTNPTTVDNPLIQSLLNQVAELEAKRNSQSDDDDDEPTQSPTNIGGISRIDVEVDDGEALVKIFYTNGNFKDFWASSDDEDDIIDEAADETGLSTSEVERLIDFDDYDDRSKSDDAEDIDEIIIDVDVEDGVAEITVVFEDEDEDEDEFEVEEVDLEDIIEEIADELDIDEDDVRDLMDVDYNIDEDDIDEINVEIDGDEATAEIELESGDDFEIWLEEDDEDDIIEELAELLDIDEDEIEDLTDFDEV